MADLVQQAPGTCEPRSADGHRTGKSQRCFLLITQNTRKDTLPKYKFHPTTLPRHIFKMQMNNKADRYVTRIKNVKFSFYKSLQNNLNVRNPNVGNLTYIGQQCECEIVSNLLVLK